jgi:alanine racemase
VYTIESICKIVKGRFLQHVDSAPITHLVFDSRQVSFADTSLFFAFQTNRQDGHNYIQKTYQKGVRNFIVSKQLDGQFFEDANIILVPDAQKALQTLALIHRQQFSIPVIGITGSNGKTIVKEWLYQLLHDDHNNVRSPKSYNSQIGVPVSVWQINKEHTLGIFEAGVSQAGEMKTLAAIIQPNIGVLTNIGEAHNEGFTSLQQKLEEKLKLFKDVDVLIAHGEFLEDSFIDRKIFTWGKSGNNNFQIVNAKKERNKTVVQCIYKNEEISFTLPFTDEASIENCITCICVLYYLNYDKQKIQERLLRLHAVDMRLQLKQGINHCTIINDSYSADLTSLNIALHFLKQQKTSQQKIAILSDFVETGKTDIDLYKAIADALLQNGIKKLIAVGEKCSSFLPQFLPAGMDIQWFKTTEECIQIVSTSFFSNATILVKGARSFGFERIVQLLETKLHQTVLEINLNAIAHNLKQYQRILPKYTKVMAMVKAFAYGSGGAEIAGILQFNNVDYLGVAYVDEGIELRKSGISIPVMVLNTDESSFSSLVEYSLQPVIFSFQLLHQFEQFLKDQGLNNYPVHLEIETGMNRLGFQLSEIDALANHLQQSSFIKVESVFSHLAASEDAKQDEFTNKQAALLQQTVHKLSSAISYHFLTHVANSAAITRHPHLQMDMVRLGIGLYGVGIGSTNLSLQPVATLRSTIAQIKKLKTGETVSYNRGGVVKKDSVIATVRIGYADGYSRRLSNGAGRMWVNGQHAPVIGTVCMDMTMIDVSDVPGVEEGDDVIIFGAQLPVQQLAEWAGTIPYEIMTSISQRVKRVYFQE